MSIHQFYDPVLCGRGYNSFCLWAATYICPPAHPYAVDEGCCKYHLRLNDVSLNPVCDGTAMSPSDPSVCCDATGYLPESTCGPSGVNTCANNDVTNLDGRFIAILGTHQCKQTP